MIYFDNAATTKIDSDVLNSMLPYLTSQYGNPNGKYYPLAIEAKKATELAREQVAQFLKCSKDEVVFNSGASEGNNHVIKTFFLDHIYKPQHYITTKIEHSSVLETFKYIESLGANVTYLDVDSCGKIDIQELEKSITPNTVLCSIGYVNSEIGTIQDMKSISEVCTRNNLKLHSDITQAIGKIRFDLSEEFSPDFLTFSAHKLYGPKGAGCLIVRKDPDGIPTKISPLIHGGSQESGKRSGTTPTALIVGLGKACEIMNQNFEKISMHLSQLDEYFIKLVKQYGNDVIYINNDFKDRVPGIINVQFKGINNQILLKKISQQFAASTGSACSNSKPSYVLQAIGKTEKETQESIRFSLGKYNNKNEVHALFTSLLK
jgi:cysteine desulfurase